MVDRQDKREPAPRRRPAEQRVLLRIAEFQEDDALQGENGTQLHPQLFVNVQRLPTRFGLRQRARDERPHQFIERICVPAANIPGR